MEGYSGGAVSSADRSFPELGGEGKGDRGLQGPHSAPSPPSCISAAGSGESRGAQARRCPQSFRWRKKRGRSFRARSGRQKVLLVAREALGSGKGLEKPGE